LLVIAAILAWAFPNCPSYARPDAHEQAPQGQEAVETSQEAATALRTQKVDRQALVSRHSVSFDRIDPTSPVMVGNGNLAFTADITGLQTFPQEYSPLAPLLTEAQWAWHSFPNPEHHRYEDSLVPVKVHGDIQYYPWLRDWSEARRPAIAWLRENPHRISLGRVSLYLVTHSGIPARLADLSATHQTLDLWNGALLSRFELDGGQVEVQTRVHPELDMLIVTLTGAPLRDGRLGVVLKFPGVSTALNPDPADWIHPQRHKTLVTRHGPRRLSLTREIDSTRYFVAVRTSQDVSFTPLDPHAFRILPRGADRPDTLTVMVLFSEHSPASDLPNPAAAEAAVTDHWHRFWGTGGAVDLSGSTDPRALELERRIVLSQYLMAVNASGALPPQEEGLFSNSWYGKFHLEMHLWHAGHFALWGHPELLERSMPWYLEHLKQAQARARAHGLRGAWWPKMVGPDARESPSPINPFIMWQQPSPIYLCELLYRAMPTRATLLRYRDLVLESADLLASFAQSDRAQEAHVLGPPLIPAQEVYAPLDTFDPAFELTYFRLGLLTAQTWRERLGLPRSPQWDEAIQKLASLPQRDGIYLPTASVPRFWELAASPECSEGHTAPACLNRDHPSVLGALGMLPGDNVDHETMRRTLRAVEAHWDLRQTWGWDFPLMAMTAARLHEPDKALDLLFYEAPNNRWGPTGMTPREHLQTEASVAGGPASGGRSQMPHFTRDAETYFPSNGSLLFAVAMMAAGWDGEPGSAPGFPHDGRWQVKSEGVLRVP
jgi:hypothetical protein